MRRMAFSRCGAPLAAFKPRIRAAIEARVDQSATTIEMIEAHCRVERLAEMSWVIWVSSRT